jgi:hypothetical protein
MKERVNLKKEIDKIAAEVLKLPVSLQNIVIQNIMESAHNSIETIQRCSGIKRAVKS